ncbi:unnamed protein product [Trichobilharzia regenti]|nr:unnamed protein product [Trichobilharzia regenti]
MTGLHQQQLQHQHHQLKHQEPEEQRILLPDTDQSNSDSNENDYMNTGMLSKNYSETKKLLLKVTITVGIKIITTILITVIFNNVTAIKTVLNEHPWISPVFGIQALLFGGLLFFVPNSLTSKPWNYILLSLIVSTIIFVTIIIIITVIHGKSPL